MPLNDTSFRTTLSYGEAVHRIARNAKFRNRSALPIVFERLRTHSVVCYQAILSNFAQSRPKVSRLFLARCYHRATEAKPHHMTSRVHVDFHTHIAPSKHLKPLSLTTLSATSSSTQTQQLPSKSNHASQTRSRPRRRRSPPTTTAVRQLRRLLQHRHLLRRRILGLRFRYKQHSQHGLFPRRQQRRHRHVLQRHGHALGKIERDLRTRGG